MCYQFILTIELVALQKPGCPSILPLCVDAQRTTYSRINGVVCHRAGVILERE